MLVETINMRYLIALLVWLVACPVWAGSNQGVLGSIEIGIATPTAVSDNFNRVDENPLSGGGNWTTVTNEVAPKIVSNVIVPGTADVWNASYYSGATFANDQYSRADIQPGGTNGEGLICRVQSGVETMYRLHFSSAANKWRVYKIVNGTSSQLGTDSGTFPIYPATVEMRCTGTSTVTIEYIYNGTSQGTQTDSSSTITGGNPGIELINSGAALDNWYGGDL